MPNPQYQPASVLDIVSFGYRQVFKILWPLTKLALPFLILCSVTMGALMPSYMHFSMGMQSHAFQSGFQENFVTSLFYGFLFFIIGVLQYYLFYVFLCFIQDLYLDTVKPNLFSYWLPQKNLLGLLGISFLFLAASIPASVILLIGFILLVLPGLAVLAGILFFMIRLAFTWIAYMLEPETGILDAFQKSWALTQHNFWRSVGLLCLILVIQGIIFAPFGLISIIITGLSFSLMGQGHFVFSIVYTLYFAIRFWAQYVIGIGGLIFISYRYVFDLEARKNATVSIVPPETGDFPEAS